MQSDPIGLDAGVNTYIYVKANPLARSDSNGLSDQRPIPVPDPKLEEFQRVCSPLGVSSLLPDKDMTVVECFKKAKEGIVECNKFWAPWDVFKKHTCQECWKFYEGQCPGCKIEQRPDAASPDPGAASPASVP